MRASGTTVWIIHLYARCAKETIEYVFSLPRLNLAPSPALRGHVTSVEGPPSLSRLFAPLVALSLFSSLASLSLALAWLMCVATAEKKEGRWGKIQAKIRARPTCGLYHMHFDRSKGASKQVLLTVK